MFQRKKSNKKFFYLLGCILFIMLLIFFINKEGYINTPFLKSVRNVTIEVKNFFTRPFVAVFEGFKEKRSSQTLVEENNDLKMELDYLKLLEQQNEVMAEELNELKDILELKKTYTDYDLVYASVAMRNSTYWFQTLTIDKGEKDSIKIGDAVVTNKGLIGKVISVMEDYATIKLITAKDKDNKISVGVKGKNGYHQGTIIDYQDGFLIVEGITNYDGVNINSKVLTTGLGNFPSGILVGYVSKIEKDNYDLAKILYIETMQDMNEIKHVVVLRGSYD